MLQFILHLGRQVAADFADRLGRRFREGELVVAGNMFRQRDQRQRLLEGQLDGGHIEITQHPVTVGFFVEKYGTPVPSSIFRSR